MKNIHPQSLMLVWWVDHFLRNDQTLMGQHCSRSIVSNEPTSYGILQWFFLVYMSRLVSINFKKCNLLEDLTKNVLTWWSTIHIANPNILGQGFGDDNKCLYCLVPLLGLLQICVSSLLRSWSLKAMTWTTCVFHYTKQLKADNEILYYASACSFTELFSKACLFT